MFYFNHSISREWSSISSEYEEFKDLIWIDLEESYTGIVMKTLLFIEVSHVFAEHANFKFAFKTVRTKNFDRFSNASRSLLLVSPLWL